MRFQSRCNLVSWRKFPIGGSMATASRIESENTTQTALNASQQEMNAASSSSVSHPARPLRLMARCV